MSGSSYRSSLPKAIAATILFGSAPACIRVSQLNSYSLGLARLGLAAVGMSLLLLARREFSRASFRAALAANWRVFAGMGACFGLHWLTFFLSIKWADASIGALAFSTCGVQMPLLGWAFGFGRPRVLAMVGVGLAMLGSYLCLPAQGGAQGQAIGLVVGILSGTLYAAIPMLHQRHAHVSHDLRTWGMFCFAIPVFLATAPMSNWPLSGREALLLFHLGVLTTLVGHYLWVQVTTELPLHVTSALGYLQLPASLAINAAFIGEKLTAAMATGGVFIVAGNLLALRVVPPAPAGTAAMDEPAVEDFPGDTALPLAVDAADGP
jgi:drug/metabolite transporter (DMT)-like permease